MALMKCKECSGPVSSDAKVCPKCGAKLNPSMLKFWIAILLIIWVFAAITGKDREVQAEPSTEKKVEKKIAQPSVIKDFSTPPSFERPILKLWAPNFASRQICNPPSGECREMPEDNFFCVKSVDFDENLRAEDAIISAGKSCKKWGESWSSRQARGTGKKLPKKNAPESEWNAIRLEDQEYQDQIMAEMPKRSRELDAAMGIVVDYRMKKHIHISWLLGNVQGYFVNPNGLDLRCFYKKDRDKRSQFVDSIFQRCYQWGE